MNLFLLMIFMAFFWMRPKINNVLKA